MSLTTNDNTTRSTIRLDAAWLEGLGLGALPPAVANELLADTYEELELNVGMSLAERMSDEQLDEFEELVETDDEEGALRFLETHFPDYRGVVAHELETLTVQLRAAGARLIAELGSTQEA